MIDRLTPSDQKKDWVIGFLKDTTLPAEVTAGFSALFSVLQIDASSLSADRPTLDALVLGYDDARRIPPIFHTPTILVGTDEQLQMLPQFTISEFVALARPQNESYGIDAGLVKQKMDAVFEKVHYARMVHDVFNSELSVELGMLQELSLRMGLNI